MMEKIKSKLKKLNDRGSSFVLVIVSTTFLAVLISALILGVLLAYKIKFYRLNSMNNFYACEKAMDEIYAGIGASTNEHLYAAYTTTAEYVVTYDSKKGYYMNLTNEEANDLFKKLFMLGMMEDSGYNEIDQLITTLESFITDSNVKLCKNNLKIVYVDDAGRKSYKICKENEDGSVSLGKVRENGFNEAKIQKIEFDNVGVKRTIEITKGAKASMAPGTYEQSITTDIVLTEPEYNVSFDMAGADSNSLYNFAFLADMGLQVNPTTAGTSVRVKGNIYTATDYYNKDYNGSTGTKVTNAYADSVTTKWGSVDESLYSGIYADGDNTDLTLNSDVIINAGSLSAMNGAQISIAGRTNLLSELWTDGIVIAGDEGGKINAAANAYVYDDTEINAEKSELTFTKGTYYGYSYTADDVRSVNLLRSSGNLATGYKLRSHFSDSAIIVNGKESTIDMSGLDSIYVAGKSYIEFSKIAADKVTDKEKEDKEITVDENADVAYTSLKDYSTGESFDVKSNQLIFLSQWECIPDTEVTDPDTGITTCNLRFPKTWTASAPLMDLYSDFLTDMKDGTYIAKAIKQVVSGHPYYYLYIQPGDNNNNDIDDAEEFAEKYYDMFNTYNEEITKSLKNVVKYEDFPVKLILPRSGAAVDTSKIKTNAALTYQNADDSLFYKKSTETTLDVSQALVKSATVNNKTFTSLMGVQNFTDNTVINDTYRSLVADADKLQKTSTDREESTSNFLTYLYINMRDHLSLENKKDADKKDISAWEIAGYDSTASGYTYSYNKADDKYSYDYSITPLNTYVNYDYIFSKNVSINKSISDSVVVVSTSNVHLGTSNADGSLQGIVICGGNVGFDSSVKSFKGLIIAGGKIICDNSISISADASYVAGLLQKCSENEDENINVITREILKNYAATKDENKSEVSGVSISDISYEDILSFNNWKKNVE